MSNKVQYECTDCGYVSSVKLGKCPQCGHFGTFIERKTSEIETSRNVYQPMPVRVIPTFLDELNAVLGGGFQSGSVMLLGGEPGIGKSTLALQLLGSVDGKVLYVTSEETENQVTKRAERLGIHLPNIVSAGDLNDVDLGGYDIICVDSLQTITYGSDGAPGSPVTVKDVASKLVRFSKEVNCCVIIVAHVTKEGIIAGPRTIEHMVDVVLYLEGERTGNKRLLKLVKNRFGPSTDQVLLEMSEHGLNPSTISIQQSVSEPGLVVSAVNTGTHFEFVQVHALVTESYGQMPRRISSRYPNSRLLLLTAVMQKYLKIPMYKYDVYVDITTDFFVNDYGIDAAIVAAIYSSLKERAVSQNVLVYGEILLTGGILIPQQNPKISQSASLIRTKASTVVELIKELF
ncbi:ATPase domain-containing protein [Coprothermobacter platensis]|uniref:ATPase domain-containing protein n=1 Tax=Coprothermobacter platensis TaxID=108819 RepID=UPI0003823C78|nr:ATPase domain-containing protein [Coprothermobacter platensis]